MELKWQSINIPCVEWNGNMGVYGAMLLNKPFSWVYHTITFYSLYIIEFDRLRYAKNRTSYLVGCSMAIDYIIIGLVIFVVLVFRWRRQKAPSSQARIDYTPFRVSVHHHRLSNGLDVCELWHKSRASFAQKFNVEMCMMSSERVATHSPLTTNRLN